MSRADDLQSSADRAKEEAEKLRTQAAEAGDKGESEKGRLEQLASNKDTEAETLTRSADDARRQDELDQQLHSDEEGGAL